MTWREVLIIGAFLLIFLLVGVGWYAMTLSPGKYRRPRIWLYGVTGIFLLYTVALVLLTEPSSLASIIVVIAAGLIGSAMTVLGLWIPMRQRDWAIKRFNLQQGSDKTGKQDR